MKSRNAVHNCIVRWKQEGNEKNKHSTRRINYERCVGRLGIESKHIKWK